MLRWDPGQKLNEDAALAYAGLLRSSTAEQTHQHRMTQEGLSTGGAMEWHSKLRKVLPEPIQERLRRSLRPMITKRAIDKTWKAKAKELSATWNGLHIHLGCGDQHYDWMLNCDYRATRATDVVMNCSNLAILSDHSVSAVYSHAFFEHLYGEQQLPLLVDCRRVLQNGAPLVFLGIPNFRAIAESYLRGDPGIAGIGEVFDLFHVYRYTHGSPEAQPHWWIEQLHKSLFDKEYLVSLLTMAGFRSWAIFSYCYVAEELPVNLGFCAWAQGPGSLERVRIPFYDIISPDKGVSVIDQRNCNEDVGRWIKTQPKSDTIVVTA